MSESSGGTPEAPLVSLESPPASPVGPALDVKLMHFLQSLPPPIPPPKPDELQIQLIATNNERIAVKRGLQLLKPLKEMATDLRNAKHYEWDMTKDDDLAFARLAWTWYIKWHFRELDLNKYQFTKLREYLERHTLKRQIRFLTLARIPEKPKPVLKWGWLKSFFHKGGLNWHKLPDVQAGNFDFDHYDSISEHIPAYLAVYLLSYDELSRSLHFKPSDPHFFFDPDEFFVSPKLEKINKSMPHNHTVYCGSLIFVNERLNIALGGVPQVATNLTFLGRTPLTSPVALLLKKRFVNIFGVLQAGQAALLKIGFQATSGHAVCLEIRPLPAPITIAGYIHRYQFTWLDNNQNIDVEYSIGFGSHARMKATFIFSNALDYINKYLELHPCPSGQSASDWLLSKDWFAEAFTFLIPTRKQWEQCASSAILQDFSIQVNDSYHNNDRFKMRDGFCQWWTYAFIFDMLQNNIDMRSYYQNRLVPYRKYKKASGAARANERAFILGFYVYCCCYEWWDGDNLVAPLQEKFYRQHGVPRIVSDSRQVKQWSNEYKDYNPEKSPEKIEIFVKILEPKSLQAPTQKSFTRNKFLDSDDDSSSDEDGPNVAQRGPKRSRLSISENSDSSDTESDEDGRNKRPRLKGQPTRQSTAGIFLNHTQAMVKPFTNISSLKVGSIPPKTYNPSTLSVPTDKSGKVQQVIQTKPDPLKQHMSRIDMLSRLPTVLRTPGTNRYYVTTDAIASFTAAYFEVHFPSDDQFDFIEAQIVPLLQKTEALNVSWDGESSDISVPELIKALIETVGTNGNRKKNQIWTKEAAGMVLLMWAETTQTHTRNLV